MHGSGFVAAFAGGLAYSMMVRRAGAQMPSQVTDAAGQLLELMVFAMFGSYAVFVGWRDADWRVVLFAVVALFVVRLVAVSAALVGSDLPGPQQAVHRLVRASRDRHPGPRAVDDRARRDPAVRP